ncbi:MAG: hypothetical protein ACRDVM_03845, partial [Acidimicrobiia bacterium]
VRWADIPRLMLTRLCPGQERTTAVPAHPPSLGGSAFEDGRGATVRPPPGERLQPLAPALYWGR